ncbi:MAG: phosphoglucosamine mutase [Acidimicrobiales bacterium]
MARITTVKFGTDGVRGVANIDLTPSFALDLGRAAARVLAGESRTTEAVVGGDTRVSTAMLEAAFVAGLASEGVTVHRLGVVPTPAVAFEAARRDVIGAVVSGSHNPYWDNGIKLFARGGTKLPDHVEERIEHDVMALPSPGGEPAQLHDVEESPDYVTHLLDALEGRTLEGLRIVVDCANGAASTVAPRLFRAAGADVRAINHTPNGRNINDHCGATNTSALADAMRSNGAHLGFALDGDADRLMAVDGRGNVVDGDHIMAICAADLHRRGQLRDATVVATVMSNLGFRLAMERQGISVVETPVGDRYVLEALDTGGFTMGGEQSGHVIFRDRATTGDGLLTGVILGDVVKRSGAPLGELAAAAMTRVPQVLVNVPVVERVADAAVQMAAEIAAVESQLAGRGRVLLRPSGTEPLLRVMVEATDADMAHSAADRLAGVVRARWGAPTEAGG